MNKIGIIDSGIGGIALLSELAKRHDQLNFFYQSDHANVPYGGKQQSFMLKQTSLMVEKLLTEKVELIIIACNTLTVETINILRQNYTVPFVGIEPFINYINKELYSAHEKVGIILTDATSNSKRFQVLKKELDPNDIIQVFPQAELALIIENSINGSPSELENSVSRELESVVAADLDVLILGCTHYPLITKIIQRITKCNLIDPHKEVAQRVFERLEVPLAPESNPRYKEMQINYGPEINSPWEKRKLGDFHFIKNSL